jgi:uncharacterized protein (DUF169 family)
MKSDLVHLLRLKYAPVALLLTDVKPDSAQQFKEGTTGCAAAMLLAAIQGRTVAFDRTHFGCPGGGVGLGFGNTFVGFPIDRLLSTGGQVDLRNGRSWDMGAGERFFENPGIASHWVGALPFREVPTAYIVAKPLDQVEDGESPVLVWMLVNPDQLSAVVTQIGYRRGSIENIVGPWGAACQSILFAYAECERPQPRAVLGFFDISQRHRVERDMLSLTLPYSLFREMESGMDGSFLQTEAWQKLRERQE